MMISECYMKHYKGAMLSPWTRWIITPHISGMYSQVIEERMVYTEPVLLCMSGKVVYTASTLCTVTSLYPMVNLSLVQITDSPK